MERSFDDGRERNLIFWPREQQMEETPDEYCKSETRRFFCFLARKSFEGGVGGFEGGAINERKRRVLHTHVFHCVIE
jgi:hypothetical protein